MNSIRRAALAALPALLLALSGTTAAADVDSDARADEQAFASVAPVPYRDLCAHVPAGFARCHAKVVTNEAGESLIAANPSGLSPASIQAAYKLPTTGGNGKIVAIVDAYDAVNAEKDLGTYRSTFGLPPCTTANGCFKKVNQRGTSTPPKADSGWAGEIMLDVDMVSAACPDCKILLVEADTPSTDDLGAAVNMAAQMGASAISNSYGGPEDNTVTAASAQYYNHPGIAVTVSAGDSGYGAEFPATSEFVISVGGTSLTKSASSSRGWAEKAWSKGGSGCSAYIKKPTWQTNTVCNKRLAADVSAVGDPQTGVAVYDGGWQVVGGTSASAPLVASMLVLLGQGSADASFMYSHASSFYDVTTGSNGSCGGSLMCTAGVGYDGPTGVGTFNGTALGGTTPTPPPPVDAGTPPAAPDAGPVDSGTVTPPVDSGTTTPPATPDAGGNTPVDSGTTTPPSPPLGGSDASTSPPGTIPSGGKDAGGTGTTGTNPDDGFASPAAASGCGCAVPGTTAPIGSGASAVLALGAIALVVSRRRRR